MQNAVLIGFSTLIAVLLVLALEGGLRLVGIGDPPPGDSRLRYQQVSLPLLESSQRADGTRILRPADPRLPYQSIRQEKTDDALRIAVFGGSATAGLGYSPNVAFARYLEKMLDRSDPARDIEVLNLGITAFASRQVKVLVREVSRLYEPDLVVIYSGNNEFLELHAEKYAEIHGSGLERISGILQQTNLFRLFTGILHETPETPAVTGQEFSTEDLRVSQRTIVKDIDVDRDEIEHIIDRYAENIDEAVASATEVGAKVILMQVGANWKWRGRDDLPETWLDELLGHAAGPTPENYEQARVELTSRLQAAPKNMRSELLFKRAVASEQLGDFSSAKRDYRAAMNEDPHLRRALDSMNERLGQIASRRNVRLIETVDILSNESPHGIVGFELYYDYVHFTPKGALVVSAAVLKELVEMGLVGGSEAFSAEQFIGRQLDWLGSATEDHFDVENWLGMSTNPGLIEDRDLWKYERMVEDLDLQLEAEPGLPLLVYRGNAHFFELHGAASAARLYREALLLSPGHAQIRHNLTLLEQEGRLGH